MRTSKRHGTRNRASVRGRAVRARAGRVRAGRARGAWRASSRCAPLVSADVEPGPLGGMAGGRLAAAHGTASRRRPPAMAPSGPRGARRRDAATLSTGRLRARLTRGRDRTSTRSVQQRQTTRARAGSARVRHATRRAATLIALTRCAVVIAIAACARRVHRSQQPSPPRSGRPPPLRLPLRLPLQSQWPLPLPLRLPVPLRFLSLLTDPQPHGSFHFSPRAVGEGVFRRALLQAGRFGRLPEMAAAVRR